MRVVIPSGVSATRLDTREYSRGRPHHLVRCLEQHVVRKERALQAEADTIRECTSVDLSVRYLTHHTQRDHEEHARPEPHHALRRQRSAEVHRTNPPATSRSETTR